MDNDDDMAAGRRRRKQAGPASPVIDLQATEVASGQGPAQSEPVEPAVASDSPAPEAPPAEAATVDATPAAEANPWAKAPDEPAQAPKTEHPREEPIMATREPEAPRVPRLDVFDEEAPKPSRLPLAIAALVGGVLGGAIVLAAELAGLVPGPAPASDNLAPRLAAIEQELASARQTLDRTSGKLGQVETAAKGASETAASAVALAEEAKAAAANAPASGGQQADISPLTKRLDESDKALAELRSSVAPLAQQSTAAATAATQAQTEVEALQKRLAALEQVVTAHNPDRVAAYTVALSQLGEAVRTGRPFEPELQAASALGGDPKALDLLAPLAAKGTPSIGSLTQSFDALAPTLISALTPKPAAAPAPAEPGILDRFLASFSSVVSVTREDEPDTLEAAKPVKAVSDALHRGDLAAAVDAFAAMPEPARTAGAAWLVEAKASLDANALVRTQSAAALKTLSSK